MGCYDYKIVNEIIVVLCNNKNAIMAPDWWRDWSVNKKEIGNFVKKYCEISE